MHWYKMIPTSNVFCPTGDGGGKDPTCKKGARGKKGVAKSSKASSKKKVEKKQDKKPSSKTGYSRDAIEKMTVEEFDSIAKTVGPLKLHGMSNSEEFRGVRVDGVDVYFGPGAAAAAHESVKSSKQVHPKLWSQNKTVMFTNQEDSKAAAIAKQNGLTEFTSAASGGDGTIVVYGSRSITSDSLAHESAHNLAFNLWGRPVPDVFDTKNNFAADRKVKLQGMQQRITNAVTDYGSTSPAEDFAEYVTAYNEIVSQGKDSYREASLKSLKARPKALAVVKKLLED